MMPVMTDDPPSSRKLAVLIDADNASPAITAGLFEEITKIGEASMRRIYGDFTGTRLKGWADIAPLYACLPHQNFANTVGKNASDIALVIDAMDLLHSGWFNGFCLVSSDGDFHLTGSTYPGAGDRRFWFRREQDATQLPAGLQTLHLYRERDLTRLGRTGRDGQSDRGRCRKGDRLAAVAAAALIKTALGQLDDHAGWYFLGSVGQRLIALTPDFDPRNYGCAKLITLTEKIDAFDVRRDGFKVYIRPRRIA